MKSEIEQGIASVGAVLGKGTAANAFFRIPGFLRRQEVETYLQSRRLMTWSADVVADDWRHINASEVVRRAIARLDEKGKGILLLHDIQPATALALPELLRQLKAKGYRIVHVVPGKSEMSVPVAARPARRPRNRQQPTTAARPGHDGPDRGAPPAPAPVAVAVAKPEAALPQHPARAEPEHLDAPVHKPAMSASAADSLARGNVPARSGAAVHLGVETGAQHADAGQVRHHRAGRLAAGHQRAGAGGWWRRRILGGSPGANAGRALPVA